MVLIGLSDLAGLAPVLSRHRAHLPRRTRPGRSPSSCPPARRIRSSPPTQRWSARAASSRGGMSVIAPRSYSGD